MRTLIGKPLFHFAELQSTNSTALDMLSKAEPKEGTVIVADYQSEGKGQFGRTWISQSSKNLTFSVILKPEVPVTDIYFLNMSIALAVRDFLLLYLPKEKVSVKWPNDLYISDKKIAGILNQNQIRGDYVQSVVVGIGVNINQIEFPNVPNATSLYNETRLDLEVNDLLEGLLDCIDKRYHQFQSKIYSTIKQTYETNLYLQGTPTIWQDKSGKEFSGIIQGVTNSGQLSVLSKGAIQHYNHGEIRLTSSNNS